MNFIYSIPPLLFEPPPPQRAEQAKLKQRARSSAGSEAKPQSQRKHSYGYEMPTGARRSAQNGYRDEDRRERHRSQLTSPPPPQVKHRPRPDDMQRLNDPTARSPPRFFTCLIREPSFAPILARMKSFIQVLDARPVALLELRRSRLASELESFLDSLMDSVIRHPHYKHLSIVELSTIKESMEKYILSKLYTKLYRAFPSVNTLNVAFNDKVARLNQWISFAHLELPAYCQRDSLFCTARAELVRMNAFKAPKDKLIVLLNACHLLDASLREAQMQHTQRQCSEAIEYVSADLFFPSFILLLIHANIRDFIIDLNYINLGSGVGGPAMKGECDYWVTMANSAASFIQNSNEKSFQLNYDREWVARMGDSGSENGRSDGEPRSQSSQLQPSEDRVSNASSDSHSESSVNSNDSHSADSHAVLLTSTESSVSELASVGESEKTEDSATDSPSLSNTLTINTGEHYAIDTSLSSSSSHSSLRSLSPSSPQCSPIIVPFTGSSIQCLQFSFEDRAADEIRVGELETLLSEYREMAATIRRLAALPNTPI